MSVTQEQIQNWKVKYGKVFAIRVYPKVERGDVPSVENPEECLVCYVKQPDVVTVGIATKYVNTDPVRHCVELVEGCWLGGDPRIQNEPELKLSVGMQISELFKYRFTEVEEL
jgi:hypothetical protein